MCCVPVPVVGSVELEKGESIVDSVDSEKNKKLAILTHFDGA
jgi:hypothetical protein